LVIDMATSRDGLTPVDERLAVSPVPGSVEPRMLAAWREWLGALATDAAAAIAAAHVYAELGPGARDAWLDALIEDVPKLQVPKVAIYGPLLTVEDDPARRARIEREVEGALYGSAAPILALRGIARGGARVVALVSPLYLRFVQVLWCRYTADDGFAWVRHEPILAASEAPQPGVVLEGITLEVTPLTPVVEELAHAVLAQRRKGLELPRSLHLFAHLFDARLEEDEPVSEGGSQKPEIEG